MVSTFGVALAFAADTTVRYDTAGDRTMVVEHTDRNWLSYGANEQAVASSGALLRTSECSSTRAMCGRTTQKTMAWDAWV